MSDLEPTEVEERRSARERALELLYEAEIKGSGIDDVLAALPVAPAELAVELVRGVAAHSARIDEILARRVAPRWSLARLAAVDRAVLRLGTYELLDRPDRPQAVVINEAVILARRFGTDDSPRFVNGVLSAVAAEVQGDGEAEARAGEPGAARADAGHDADAAPTDPDAETPEPEVEALIIDLDGVIRHWDQDYLAEAEEALGLPAGAIGKAAFDPVRFEPAMNGELTFDEWYTSLGEAVAAEHDVAAEAVSKAFADARWDIDAEVLALVDQVRERVPVALLSNASTRLADDLDRAGITGHFDTVVGSADIGLTKPDAAAFTAAADRLGVPPERCLMVDDLADNVEGARAAGMRAVRFTGVDDLRAALVAAGLL
ncbi:MAG TPA: transcription antitermination factor NusB [Acidimicrobiales bacterium]